MKIIECEQGSPEWFLARRGVPSASNFDRILTPIQQRYSSQASRYIEELIGDIYDPEFPKNAEYYTSRPMMHGRDTEAEARHWYTLETNNDVRQVGFCLTDDGCFGCSPDGLVGDDGGLELKCPMVKTHVHYLRDPEAMLLDYRCQVHGALIVSGRPWWDIMSYAPPLEPVKLRIQPDGFTVLLKAALERFWEEYMDVLYAIKGLPRPKKDLSDLTAIVAPG